MTMVTHSEGLLVQADGVPGTRALKDVARNYLAKMPADVVAEVAFWVLLVFVVVASIVGVVVAVKTLKAVKRWTKKAIKWMQASITREATASRAQQAVLDRMRQIRSQNWRGVYAKAHLGLCLLVSGVGLALAAKQHAGLPFPSNLIAFVAFEGLAVAVMLRIEDRARRALPYPGLLILYWATIGVATAVQTTHIDNEIGKVIWAAFTLSGGLVYALFISTVRSDKDQQLQEWEKRWRKRRMELVRWLRPWEAIQVVWEKAADANLGTDEATRIVRERTEKRRSGRLLDRVMWSVWRLRRAEQTRQVWGLGWLKGRMVHNHTRRTQSSIMRAELHVDPALLGDLLRRLEAIDLAPKLAQMRSRSDARLIFGTYSSGGSTVGSSGGSVGSMTQFALPSGDRGGFDGPEPEGPGPGSDSDRGVRVVFVAGPSSSGSTEEFGGRGSLSAEEFDPAAAFDLRSSAKEFDLKTEGTRADSESSVSGRGFDPGSSAAEPVGSGFDCGGSVAREEFEGRDSTMAEPFAEASSEDEGGVWEHSKDGWIPPTPAQAWAREDDWPTLFDAAPTPQRRVLPLVVGSVPEPETDNVRQVRTLDQLRQEVKQAWDEKRITAISSEQIYKALGISKKRAAVLRDWLLREELRTLLEEGQLDRVSEESVKKLFNITRRQAGDLLREAVEQGLVVVEASTRQPAQ